jgi:diguanylate cyclase (GGDEF)-like protein
MTLSTPASLIPRNEEQRLRSLQGLQILDTLPEEDFDDLTTLASQIVGTPIATITLIDRDRQWFKSKVGLDGDQTSRSVAFCAHAILGDTIFEVEDATKDARFSENPLVTGHPGIRFYAGMPLRSLEGENVGTVCVIDRVPRKLDEGQRRSLKIIARQVMALMELRRVLREREVRDGERAAIQELGNLLHSCLSLDEARRVISHSVEKLFPEGSGAIYLDGPNQSIMELLVKWGNAEDDDREFLRESCWALRRGRAHRVSEKADDLHCLHHAQHGHPAFCVPMMAQGKTMGVMTVVWNDRPRTESRSEWIHWLVATVADLLAVALAGLRLREELRDNSIRDPLTNLFNRRYMEETLARELHRMQRTRLPLGILTLDLDHFKQLNDTYGHGAGDAVLRASASLLQSTFRQDDIVCRTGGEEFLVILPTADAKMVLQRADELRRLIEQMQVSYRGKALPAVTLSGGAAIFPQHGTTGTELIRAADVALYQAKERGRNQIVMTGSAATSVAAG